MASRASTPNPAAEGGTAESVVADDTLIAQCAAAVTDINTMQSRVSTLWREEISMMMSTVLEASEDEEAHTEGKHRTSTYTHRHSDIYVDALRLSLQELTSLIPSMSTNIVTILSKRCCEALTPVRSIPSQFRAMSNKRMPTDPSYFVGSVLRPVKAFFAIGTAEGPGQALKSDYLKSYSREVFENVIQRYVPGYLLKCLILTCCVKIYLLLGCDEKDGGVAEATEEG